LLRRCEGITRQRSQDTRSFNSDSSDGVLQQAAKALDGTLTLVSPDDRDVRQLLRHITTRFVAARAQEGGARWHDMGYRLTPFICLLALAWFRPGWVVQEA
jgi:hypothetical protein